jgi:hypothetical protein
MALEWLTGKKVTYKRDVGKERKKLQREQDRLEVVFAKQIEREERVRKAVKKKADDVDRKIEREWREKGMRNPSLILTRKPKAVKVVGKGRKARLLIFT